MRKRVEEIVRPRALFDSTVPWCLASYWLTGIALDRFTADLDDSEQIDLDQPLMQANSSGASN